MLVFSKYDEMVELIKKSVNFDQLLIRTESSLIG
jgi:hypothetical protein